MAWWRRVAAGPWGAVLLALAVAGGCDDRGRAPRIADPGPQVAVVGEPLVMLVQATDPDGDALEYAVSSYTLPDLDEASEITVGPDGRAIFTWTPVADDLGEHVIALLVTDGTYEAALPVAVEVRGAAGEGSEPTFVEPLGEGLVHDLADGPCVPPVSIAVSDPDDASIVLRQAEPVLTGAELTASPDGREGLWNWCPSAAQQAAASPHELVLEADDGKNPPTHRRFSLWLERDGVRCPCACEDDEAEDDDDLAQALAKPAVPEGARSGRLCPLDDDWLRIELPQRARVRALLAGARPPDMALQLTDASGLPLVLAATPGTSDEAIDSACLDPGTYALRVFSPEADAGDYQLSHVLDVDGC